MRKIETGRKLSRIHIFDYTGGAKKHLARSLTVYDEDYMTVYNRLKFYFDELSKSKGEFTLQVKK